MSLPLLHLDLVARLRADLRAGVYQPGQRLVEPELAERYGSPRSAVRAALLVLTGERLVERTPHQSARVRTLTLDEAIELAEVRGILEPLAAQRAAACPDEDKAVLTSLFDEMGTSSGRVDDPRYVDLSNRFHDQLSRVCGQHAISRYLDELRNLPIHTMFPTASDPGLDEGHTVEHHRAILEAILDGDGARARRAMIDDLTPDVRALLSIRNEIVDDLAL